jgi:hypothetical protein
MAFVLVGCAGDDATPTSTSVTITLGEPLPVGSTYEDPTGNVTLTVRGVRLTGDLLLADAEACASDTGLPALPILPAAWQLRVQGREQTIPRVDLDEPVRAARPPWPDTVELATGECFAGKVAFRLPEQARPAAIVFTQLGAPVAWTIRS